MFFANAASESVPRPMSLEALQALVDDTLTVLPSTLPVRLSAYMPHGRYMALTIGSDRNVMVRVPGIEKGHIVKIGGAIVMHPETLKALREESREGE